MMKQYQSDYANQVHQLSVSVSKHIYVTSSGNLKFQKKPFELDLLRVREAERTHVLHYLVRDHLSGAFYGEICSSKDTLPVEDFLRRAWSVKPDYLFCGVPDHITIPKTVSVAFPGIFAFVESLGVEAHEPTSGFHAGVRDVRTWENDILMNMDVDDDWKTLKGAQSKTLEMVIGLNGPFLALSSKIRIWARRVKEIRDLSGRRLQVAFRGDESLIEPLR